MKIKFTFLILLMAFMFIKAQNEFVTVWQPGNSSSAISGYTASTRNQIYFPGVGTNYKIYWEEVGNASHNGTLTNVTSMLGQPVLIDFGSSTATAPKYTLKVSNGIGSFTQIMFSNGGVYDYGDIHKFITLSQWGNIHWTTMNHAFADCLMSFTTTDTPDLTNVTDFHLFFNCIYFIGNSSFANWDTSKITDMSNMFNSCYKFNQNIGNWDTSKVTDMSEMFILLRLSTKTLEIGAPPM